MRITDEMGLMDIDVREALEAQEADRPRTWMYRLTQTPRFMPTD